MLFEYIPYKNALQSRNNHYHRRVHHWDCGLSYHSLLGRRIYPLAECYLTRLLYYYSVHPVSFGSGLSHSSLLCSAPFEKHQPQPGFCPAKCQTAQNYFPVLPNHCSYFLLLGIFYWFHLFFYYRSGFRHGGSLILCHWGVVPRGDKI